MSRHELARYVIIGVGNELYGDDGVGVAVARALAQTALPSGVRVVEGHVGGLDLLFEMEGATHVIIVDAVELGRQPGEIVVFTPQEGQLLPAGSVASLHHLGLEHVLALAELSGVKALVQVVGIQPERVGAGEGLSAAVAAAVPHAVAEVRALLEAARQSEVAAAASQMRARENKPKPENVKEG